MPKLFLRVWILALSSLIAASGTHAALRPGDTGAMSATSNCPRPCCASCSPARMPWSGDTTTLDPQPLPLKLFGDGPILRR